MFKLQIVGRKPGNKDPGEVEAYAATMAKVGEALTAAAAGLLATPSAQVGCSSSSSSDGRADVESQLMVLAPGVICMPAVAGCCHS
jgi:hypothetical protein